ncbi:apoptosis-inducing factor 1, mitochondrial isoform X2 [Aricia agestis]|uniref:apoptosis-inducing factor 1, mitochondrial isoform X2 n=1 Tax=Aricia agestis TaxID=91739 RepID=UPI001C2091D7|nr:apoptosis-inducing factor 1, mitochondrial isoform X2 [Aricia agestis]
MLRSLAKVCVEKQYYIGSKDVFGVLYARTQSQATTRDHTVITSKEIRPQNVEQSAAAHDGRCAPPPPPSPSPPPPPKSPRSWAAVAALIASAALGGGVYFYKKYLATDESAPSGGRLNESSSGGASAEEREERAEPASGAGLPAHAQFLVLGGGTAAFAAMRAIRSARPEAQVLLVSEERALPYMRPPLSKEVWREAGLARAADAAGPDALTFRQWNGRRRPLLYEPPAFYASPERLREGGAGAAVARGWRALRLDVERREALLATPRGDTHTLTYDNCLIATGARAVRVPELAAVAAAGRSLALRTVADAARLAELLERPDTRDVLLVGAGPLGVELAAALAERLGERVRVTLAYRGATPLERSLPAYLGAEVARRLMDAGVALLPCAAVAGGAMEAGRVRVALAGGGAALADVVVECAGAEPAAELAAASGLELHEGAVLVNAELQARAGVWAAGDAASVWSAALGRRRGEHHDHAVLSGRRAGENMLGAARVYDHLPMYWSDVGPRLGYEAVGITDASLRTVGVFSSDAVTTTAVEGSAVAEGAEAKGAEAARRYERGVVFYLRGERVVGVLLWNLFNRIQLARQVVSQGKFDDLFEVAKLFALHEEE